MNLPVIKAFIQVLPVVIMWYIKISHMYQRTAIVNSNNSTFYIPGIDEGLWLMGGEAEGDM
jgi:hypothetical protein